MKSYYYLIAQLPSLSLDHKPPMSSSSFISLASSMMDKEDAELLSLVLINLNSDFSATGCAFIDNWQEWERTLRLNLAKNRAVKLKREPPSEEAPAFPADAAAAALKIVNELFAGDSFLQGISPLAAEIALDAARWSAIDSLAGYEQFSREAVYAYLLKLLLLERRQLFEAEKGFAEYKSLYNEIIEDSGQGLMSSE